MPAVFIFKCNIQMIEVKPVSQQILQTKQSLQANQTERQRESQKQIPFFSIFRFITNNDAILVIIGLISSVLLGGALPLFSLLWGDIANSFANTDSMVHQTKSLLFQYLYIGGGALFVGWGMHSSFMIASQRQMNRCRKQYLRQLMKQEVGWFETQNQTEIAPQFIANTLLYHMAIGEKISNFIMNVFLFISGLVIALIRGWELSLVLLGFSPFLIYSWNLMYRVYAQKQSFEADTFLSANCKAAQTLASIKTVKQFNSQEFQFKNFKDKLKDAQSHESKFIAKLSWIQFFANLFFLLMFALGFWYGSQCVKGSKICPRNHEDRYTGGDVITIFFCMLIPALNVQQLSPSLKKIGEGKLAAAKIFKIIDRKPLIQSPKDPKVPYTFKGAFKFQNVTFSFPKDTNKIIFKNLNLQISCKHSGFMGISGCGKSTIFQLMMRFYDPQQGRILLDDIDIKELDLKWLRSQIGYVNQQPLLFATSIRENILLGKPDASDEEIINALKKAEIYQFVDSLKDKLQTNVGSFGSQLSGGQKQRLAIARALLKDPKILLLDEATSSLDRRNEKLIQHTINKISTEKITITIAHRLKTIIDCDQIFVFDHDGLVQKGKFQDLNKFKENNQLYKKVEEQNEEINNQQIQLVNYKKQSKQQVTTQNININLRNSAPIESQIQLVKQEQKQKATESQGQLSRLFSYTKNHKCLLIFGTFASIIQGIALPSISIHIARVLAFNINYDQNPQYYSNQIKFQCIIMLITAFLGSIANKSQYQLFLNIGSKIGYQLQCEVYCKILKMPASWFDKDGNQTERLGNRLSTEGKIAKEFFSLYLPYLFVAISSISIGIIMAFYFQWRTALVALGLFPLIGVVGGLQTSITYGNSITSDNIHNQSTQILSETISNLKTILSFCNEEATLTRYSKILEKVYNLEVKKSLLTGFIFGLSYLALFAIYGLIFYISSLFVRDNNLQVKDAFSAIFLVIFSGLLAGSNLKLIPDLQNIRVSIKKFFDILDSEDEDQRQIQQNSILAKKQIKGNIQFRNVTFKYQNRDNNVLNNISFSIKQGDSTAIIGSSGCGKSTIIQLLLRFYQPSQGSILVEGINIKDYDIYHLRKSFGVVSQEPILFDDSIKYNIIYNREDDTQQDLKLALTILNFQQNLCQQNLEEIDIQSKVFEKMVGPRGTHLSGGQKQRVAIARAVIRYPQIMLLDEATSALDKDNEERIEQMLKGIMADKTVIKITHKLQSLKSCNQILLLQGGKIVQKGQFDQLVNLKKGFYRLLNGFDQL